MKTFLRKIFFFILYYIGIGHFFKRYNEKQKKIPVLLFHRVSDDIDEFWEPTTTDLFFKIIHFLNKQYDFITIDELLKGETRNFKNKCLITFDDGYDDFAKNALPVLEKLGIKSTFFITSNCISDNRIIWTSELNSAIDNSEIKTLTIKEDDFSGEFSLSTHYQKLKTAGILLDYLKKQENQKRIDVLDKIKTQLNYIKPENLNMLSWDNLDLIKGSVDIQSHSVTHPMMTTLNDIELQFELKESKKKIEEKLQTNISYFSYPIGDYNRKVADKTKEHYDAAFIVGQELLNTENINNSDYRYQLPRINITDKSIYEVYFRINGFHSLLRKKLK